MNDSKIADESEIVFVVADIDNAACPVCGQPVTGYDINGPMGQVGMWYDPGKQVTVEPDGPIWIITLVPCDHRVNSVVFTKEAIEQRGAAHD